MSTPSDPIKVYDARWESGEFSDSHIIRLFEATLAYARLIHVDTVTITRDARLAAAGVLETAVAVALRLGFRVFVRYEPISTPQSYFTTLHVTQSHPNTMGLTITASHNPRQYIGVKFTVPTVHSIGYDCGPLGGLAKVRELYRSPQSFPSAPGSSLTVLDLAREYIDFSLKAAHVAPNSLAGLNVVLDTFHGSAGPELYSALTTAGCNVHPVRLTPNGEFPTGSPNPTSHNKLKATLELPETKKAHILLGIDGDGDRMVFGDSRGLLTAGFAFIPILKAQLAALPHSPSPAPHTPSVLYDPKVSPVALAQWAKLGAKPVLFRNGHSQIKDYMSTIHAIAAAEESGHYYHQLSLGSLTAYTENSLFTILLFLAALKQQPSLMNELWTLQNQIFTTGEFNYQFDSDSARDAAYASLTTHLKNDGAASVTSTPDGIDLQGTCLSKGVSLNPNDVQLAPDWYSGYIRSATNEKSVLRSYFSAATATLGRSLHAQARTILESQFHGRQIE